MMRYIIYLPVAYSDIFYLLHPKSWWWSSSWLVFFWFVVCFVVVVDRNEIVGPTWRGFLISEKWRHDQFTSLSSITGTRKNPLSLGMWMLTFLVVWRPRTTTLQHWMNYLCWCIHWYTKSTRTRTPYPLNSFLFKILYIPDRTTSTFNKIIWRSFHSLLSKQQSSGWDDWWSYLYSHKWFLVMLLRYVHMNSHSYSYSYSYMIHVEWMNEWIVCSLAISYISFLCVPSETETQHTHNSSLNHRVVWN